MISDGQNANQNTFNNAFLSRQADSSTTGKIDLLDEDSAAITDVQATLNQALTRNINQDTEIQAIEDRINAALSSSIGAVDAGQLVQTDLNGFIQGSLLRNIAPTYADDAQANTRYGGKFGGEIYYNSSTNHYYEWSVASGAWVLLGYEGVLSKAISLFTGVSSQLLKTDRAGFLSKTFLRYPGNSFASDALAVTGYGTAQAGMLYYNTTDNVMKFYNGTAWVALNPESTMGIQSSAGATDANKYIKTAADGHLDKTFNTTVPSFTSDANYVTSLGRSAVAGDRYYNSSTLTLRVYSGTAWTDAVPAAAATVGIQSSTGSSDANKFIKSDADGHLSKTFNTTIPSYSSDAGYVSFLGRSAVVGDRYYNTTIPALKIYDGTSWVSAGGGSTALPKDEVTSTSASSYTALLTDDTIIADTTNNDVTVNLPALSGNTGKRYTIMNNGTTNNNVVIDANASENLDGVLTKRLMNTEKMTIVAGASEWRVVSMRARAFVTATSGVKTATGSGRWHAFTGNSITLRQGRWMVQARADFGTAAATNSQYLNLGVTIAPSNGTDSVTYPGTLANVSGLTVVGMDYSNGDSPQNQAAANDTYSLLYTGTSIVDVSGATSSPLFVVAYSEQGVSANTRISVLIQATKIGD